MCHHTHILLITTVCMSKQSGQNRWCAAERTRDSLSTTCSGSWLVFQLFRTWVSSRHLCTSQAWHLWHFWRFEGGWQCLVPYQVAPDLCPHPLQVILGRSLYGWMPEYSEYIYFFRELCGVVIGSPCPS